MRILIFLFVLNVNCLMGQWKWPSNVFVSGIKDSKSLIIKPFQSPEKSLVHLGVFSSSLFLINSFDQPIYQWVNNNQKESVVKLSHNFLEPLGGAKYSLPVLGAMFIVGQIKENDFLIHSSTLAMESFVISSLLVRIPKHLFHRARPYHGLGPNQWTGPMAGQNNIKQTFSFLKANDYTAFPSGHTTAIFAMASAISFSARKYKQSKWVDITAYSLATLVAMSRVYEGQHWVTDVVAGAGISILVSKFLSENHHWKIN